MPGNRDSVEANSVFLNIPYDQPFERLYLAYLAGLNFLGLVPRAALEIGGGRNRLERIIGLLRECRYSVHDLSRVQLDRIAPRTPRFNMPFELGLAAAVRFGPRSRHDFYCFESVPRRLQKSLSDLNGTDPYIHHGTVRGVMRELCNAFHRGGRQPTVPEMTAAYRNLRRALPEVTRTIGSQDLFQAHAFAALNLVAAGIVPGKRG